MSLSLLTIDNHIIEIILRNIDKKSHLIVGLSCKELYKTIKTFNPNEKLIGSLKYLTSNVNLLQYAHENDCPWSEKTCHDVAMYGHLECLKYAHENGCPWNHYTSESAAINGHLECLKYCHENGCLWSVNTCNVAIMNGHLECLQYARDNGCPE
jgi:hypothetical protein